MNEVSRAWDEASQRHKLASGKIAYMKDPYDIYIRFNLYKIFLEKLPVSNHALEIGCGAGYNLSYLLSTNKIAQADAIDISKEMLEIAQERLSKWPVNFYLGDFLDLDIKDKYEVVISIQSINYFKDLREFFKKTSELIKENGVLIVADGQAPYIGILNRLKRCNLLRRLFNKPALKTDEDTGIYFHNVKEVREKAKLEGFEVYYMTFFGHLFYKTTTKFQMYAESHLFKYELTKKIILGVYKVFSLLCALEMKVLKNRNIGNPIYGIIFKKLKDFNQADGVNIGLVK